MPTDSVTESLLQSLPPHLQQSMEGCVPTDSLKLSDITVPEVAFHDFHAYEYIFNPHPVTFVYDPRTCWDDWLIFYEWWKNLSFTLEESITSPWLQSIAELYSNIVAQAIRTAVSFYERGADDPRCENVRRIGEDFLSWGVVEVGVAYRALNPGYREAFMRLVLRPFISDAIENDWLSSRQWYTGPTYETVGIDDAKVEGKWWGPSINWLELARRCREFAGNVARGQSWVSFPTGTLNWGQRVTYRQDWRWLGNQSGELVRTIPLGPGQKDRVSFKVLRRNKGTRRLEKIVTTETTTESSDATKDSTDIVEEAASANKWYVDTEASANVLFASAKISAGISEDSSEKSSSDKKHLSETMQKTAHKMRRESKIIVSTESEESFEETRSSEVGNPNDEIAITLAFNKLQRQAEVYTYLAEVASVVFVAEEVPVVSRRWIGENAWIIRRVLLDESFADTVNYICSHPRPGSDDPTTDDATKLGTTLDKVDFQGGQAGGSITNIYDQAISGYRASVAEKRTRRAEAASQLQREQELKQHIRDNILHYARAIWSREDPDVRMLRYSNIYAPTVISYSGDIEGQWQVASDVESFARLGDVVNPAGPIGYVGNYAVFYLRNGWDAQSNEALTYHRLRYAEPVKVSATTGDNTGMATPEAQPIDGFLLHFHPYTLTFVGGDAPVLELKHRDSTELLWTGGYEADTWIEIRRGNKVDVPVGIKFRINTQGGVKEPKDGDSYYITPFYPRLCDPELAAIKRSVCLPDADTDDEADYFSDALLADMFVWVPGLKDKLAVLGNKKPDDIQSSWDAMTLRTQRDLLRSVYHEYLLRREHTRRFVVDTNSLIMNLEVGTGSALEPFKRAHRYLDVAKAGHDVLQSGHESKRREKLIQNEQLGDPEIERVILVGAQGERIAGIVAGVEAHNGSDQAGTDSQ